MYKNRVIIYTRQLIGCQVGYTFFFFIEKIIQYSRQFETEITKSDTSALQNPETQIIRY